MKVLCLAIALALVAPVARSHELYDCFTPYALYAAPSGKKIGSGLRYYWSERYLVPGKSEVSVTEVRFAHCEAGRMILVYETKDGRLLNQADDFVMSLIGDGINQTLDDVVALLEAQSYRAYHVPVELDGCTCREEN
ncbi:MAG: hypothetical protein AAGA38_01765 [Pseudomonadota bacterium]